MRKTTIFCCFFLLASAILAQGKIKKGLGFGAIPAVSYDSDLGFQYGAILNLFHYGDGSSYPSYNHSLYLEYSRYTKGSSISRVRYDSDKFIPKVRTTIDVSYLTDLLSDFYGYNGYQTILDQTDFKTTRRIFYKNELNMFRAKADFQGSFGESKFGWVAGYSYYNFEIDTVNTTKLKIKNVVDGSLYENFKTWGLIKPQEANGGNIHYFKVGLKYDTRDQIACPMKGIWTEAVLQSAPKFANQTFPHTKFALIHRQYFTLAKDFSFAYRLDYQMTVGNDYVPFYAQPLLITSFLTSAVNQGLGGKNSIRGILRNRVVGDAVGFANVELRYKFLRFEWLKQNFYLATNVFFDTGLILKPIAIDQAVVAAHPDYFQTYNPGQLHSAAGLGLKIGWNENFIISTDIGKTFNKQDGNTGVYVGLNYLF